MLAQVPGIGSPTRGDSRRRRYVEQDDEREAARGFRVPRCAYDPKPDRTPDAFVARCSVPEISRFYGIVITMNFDDHVPPHFHARYGEQKASIEIATAQVCEGWLSPRPRRLVAE
jgi:hypothetical protein